MRRYGFTLAFLMIAATAGCHAGKNNAEKPKVAPGATQPAVPVGGSTGATGGSTGQIPGTTGAVVTGTATTTPGTQGSSTDAYVTSFLLNELQLLDVGTATAKTRVQTGKGPAGLAVSGSYAYVANSMARTVSVVDRLANQVVATIDVGSAPITGLPSLDKMIQPLVRPVGIAVLPNGTKAYTANLLNVTSIDLASRTPLRSIFALNLNFSSGIGSGLASFLAKPLAALGAARVAATNQRAFVANLVTNNVTMISATDDKVMLNTSVGKLPTGVAIAAGKVYVTCAMTGEIWILDATTGLVRSSFKAGLMPFDVAASPSGDRVYVTNLAGGDVTIIDTAMDLPIGTLPAGLPIASILQQLGITIPTGNGTGVAGALSAFLAAFSSGAGASAGSPGSGSGTLGALLGALTSGGSGTGSVGGLTTPNAFASALMSGFLGFMGVNSSSLGALNLPAIGVGAIAVTTGGDKIVVANWFMGQVTVTDTATLQVQGLLPGSTGLGPAYVAAAP